MADITTSTIQINDGASRINGNLTVNGNIIKLGGLSSQFLKADGSVDSTTYLSSLPAHTHDYLPLAGGTLSGALTINNNLFVGGSVSENYIAFRGTTGDDQTLYTHTFIGEYLYGGTEQSELLLFKGNDSTYGSGLDRIRHIAASHVFQTYPTAISGTFNDMATSAVPVTSFTINNDGSAVFTQSITASSFVKSGGTSSQFLKADGSHDANSYLTTTGKAADSELLDGYNLDGNVSVATRIFNNKGQDHGTYTDFNTAMTPGPNYFIDGTNGPTGTSSQWYGFMLGLGGQYNTETGNANGYASQLYWNRQSQGNIPYLYARDLEAGTWGSWRKMSAGYADTAGSANSVAWSNVSSTPTTLQGYGITGGHMISDVAIGKTSNIARLDVSDPDARIANFENTTVNSLSNIRIANEAQSTSGVNTAAAAIELVGKAGVSTHGRHAWIGAEGVAGDTYRTQLKFKIRGESNAGYQWAGTEAPTIMTLDGNGLATLSGDLYFSKGTDPKIFSGTNVGLNIDGQALYLNRYVSSNIIMATGGGNVGIGTTSVSNKLHVKDGRIEIESAHSAYGQLWIVGQGAGNESSMSFFVNGYGHGAEIPNTADGWVIGSDGDGANNRFWIYDSGAATRRFIVNPTNGNVGIGVDPSAKLHVSGNAWINRPTNKVDNANCTEIGPRMDFNNSFATGQSGYVMFRYPTYDNFLISGDYDGNVGGAIPNIQFGRQSSVYMHIRSSDGHVGIGTTFSGINTASRLTIKASEADGNQIYLVQSNDDRGWRLKAKTDGHFYLQSAYTSTNSDVLVARFDTGNVGIGTTSPSKKLHVAGSYLLSGNGSSYSSYTPDGLFNANALPMFLGSGGYSGTYGRDGSVGGLVMGYQDNGSGLYSPAYGFEVKSVDGASNANRVVRAIVMKDVDTNEEPFWINNNGAAYFKNNVGIGVTGPSYKLDVNGDISAGNNTVRTGNIRLSGVLVLSGSGAETTNSTGARLSESYGALWNFSNSATWHHQIINGSSLVGFTAAGVNHGNGNVKASGDVIAYASDKRLKRNITKIENAVEKVLKINGVTYTWDLDLCHKYDFYPYEGTEAGVLAQEVQEVLPEAVKQAPFDYAAGENKELVSKSGENYLTVKYEKIVPLLIEAIKEQQKQIDELKALINGGTR